MECWYSNRNRLAKIALLITILVIIGVILWKYQDVLNIFSLGKESVITLGVDLKNKQLF